MPSSRHRGTSWTGGTGRLQLVIGKPVTSAANAPRYIGLQTHTGRVAFRNIQLKSI